MNQYRDRVYLSGHTGKHSECRECERKRSEKGNQKRKEQNQYFY